MLLENVTARCSFVPKLFFPDTVHTAFIISWVCIDTGKKCTPTHPSAKISFDRVLFLFSVWRIVDSTYYSPRTRARAAQSSRGVYAEKPRDLCRGARGHETAHIVAIIQIAEKERFSTISRYPLRRRCSVFAVGVAVENDGGIDLSLAGRYHN